MWNGAVFIPLIDEIDTIEPGLPLARISAATAWLMKNVVSRFAVNRSRQSERRHPRRRHPRRGRGAARDVHQSVQVAVGARTASMHGGDAVVGGRVGRDRDDRQAPLGQRSDVFVEVLLRAAHRDDGGARPRRPSP